MKFLSALLLCLLYNQNDLVLWENVASVEESHSLSAGAPLFAVMGESMAAVVASVNCQCHTHIVLPLSVCVFAISLPLYWIFCNCKILR